jgi:hypothetical protein
LNFGFVSNFDIRVLKLLSLSKRLKRQDLFIPHR